VRILTGCRLHFGLLAWGATAGPRFGGAGVMLDSPGVDLAIVRDRDWSIRGVQPGCERIEQFVRKYREHRGDYPTPPPCRLDLVREIPAHAGLGSGTQLGLAVARGLAVMAGENPVPTAELARRIGRGARSSVGIHGFEQGGFIVDAGKSDRQPVGGLAARLPFPAEWRFVLVTPPEAPGLSGGAERAAFQRLPTMPAATTAELRRLISDALRPALAAEEFERFSEALYELNRRVGEAFAPVQCGPYANPRMAELARRLRAEGIRGVGQTSWGPTLFALLPDRTSTENAVARLAAPGPWADCALHIAAAKNDPAAVLVESDEFA
jgi:beta-RFAP synthase